MQVCLAAIAPMTALRVQMATIRVVLRPLHALRARLVSTNRTRLGLYEMHALRALLDDTNPNLVRLTALTALLAESCRCPEDPCALTVISVSIKMLSVKQRAQTVKWAGSRQWVPVCAHRARLARRIMIPAPELLA